MTTSAAEGTDTFGSTAPNVYPNIFQAGNGLPIENSKMDNFVIYHKNVRGLNSDERVAELLLELDDVSWDAVTLNETMRVVKQECWITGGGHMFLAAGYSAHTRGVAILVHKKWTNHITKFRAVNERVAAVDIRHKQIRLRIISAYFPHSGYGDEEVQNMYNTLSELIREAREHKLEIIIGADCNAQVGIPEEDENTKFIGQFGMKRQNARGQWLKNWAIASSMTLANTCFEKPIEKLITFTSPTGVHKQLDYFLVSRRVRGRTKDCEVTKELSIHSDHRALKLRIKIQPDKRKRKRPKTKKMEMWPPNNIERYQERLAECLDGVRRAETGVKCKHIEDAIKCSLSTAEEGEPEPTSTSQRSHIHILIRQRRELRTEDPNIRSEHSRRIKKEIRAIQRLERRSQISKILSEYRNLKSIAGIKSQKKKELICSMVSATGEEVYDRCSIANVFADFYEELYEDKHKSQNATQGSVDNVEAFTLSELCTALKQLKRGKAPDASSICAEMLQSGGSNLRNTILTCFNEIIKPQGDTPLEWRKTLIKVLHKSGDARYPQNYRPIASIPLLYKLFSRLIYNRLEPILDPEQSFDQAGFRKQRATVDHLFTTTLVQDIADEWRVPVWVAAVDFKKAFDSVTHDALWSSLREQRVPGGYIELLQKLYQEQVGVVRTERLSKEFRIEKGVKQGDPLSSLLFNSASERVMRKLKCDWEDGDYGIRMSSSDEKLSNLRFADDILLLSHSLESIAKMIAHLSMEAKKSGLVLHPDKTKILHNNWAKTRNIPTHTNANGMQIEVLKTDETTKYLGRKLSFSDPHRVELESRISCAWRKFYVLKHELTGKHYSLNDRLRLFHGTVTPTALYGCETWALSSELEHRLRKTQRQMLRMILRVPRRMSAENQDEGSDGTSEPDPDTIIEDNTEHLEPWVDWIRRTTHEAERRMRELKLDDWVSLHRKRKWRWAKKVASSHIPNWCIRVLKWQPGHRVVSSNYSRRVGRPKLRWTDDIRSHIFEKVYNAPAPPSLHARLDNITWLHHAQDSDLWDRLEHSFIHRCQVDD